MRALHIAIACGALGAFALVASPLGGCSSAARYPACERDEQCAVSGKHDYCVSARCVYCRTSSDCSDRERCRAGACEIDPNAPPPRDAGEDAESSDEDAGEDASEAPPDEEEDRPAQSHRHVIPPAVRRLLRP